jgi:ABC-type phosphate transport system substrate-binding protein
MLALVSHAHAEIAIITHPDTRVAGVTLDELEKIYLGKKSRFSNGIKAEPIDQVEGRDLRKRFYKAVTEMDERAVKRYWSQRMFTGKGKPPEAMDDDQDVMKYISDNPNSLGYVEGRYVDDTVKILLILP